MLKRLENENEEQFLWRVGQAKDNGLLDINWTEIADVFNKEFREDGEERTESAYRKSYQQAKRFYDAGVFSDANDNEDRLLKIKQDIQKERMRLSDERVSYNKDLREQARRESMFDVVKRAIDSHFPKQFFKEGGNEYYSPTCPEIYDVIIHLTDVHCGVDMSSPINSYNDDILGDRLLSFTKQIREIRDMYEPLRAYVILGGDMIHGLIHTNARIESKENIVDQIMTVSDYVTDFLYALTTMFNYVEVHTTPGNHARSMQNKNEVPSKENFDLLVPYICKRAMKNVTNIKFKDNDDIDWTISNFVVKGHAVYASHGDKDSSNTVVGNMTKLARKANLPLPDICYLGHRHTNGMSTVDDVKVIESGCVDGMDSFCFASRLVGSPEQTVTLVSEDNPVKALFNIKL